MEENEASQAVHQEQLRIYADEFQQHYRDERRLHRELKEQNLVLQESEGRFRALFDDAPVGYHELDSKGIITRVNNTELAMLGYTSGEMVGSPIWDFVVEKDEVQQTFFGAGTRPEENVSIDEHTMMCKDGNTLNVLTEYKPLDDGHGNLSAVRVTVQDITERKRTEEALREAGRMACLGELAAGVAHEINNPLTGVVGLTEVMLEDSLPKTIRQDLEKIHFEAKRAARVVHDLLLFARKREPERHLVNLKDLVDRALELKAHDFNTNNILATCDIPSDLPDTLADEHQLIQVILNILTNAQQAILATHGSGYVNVSVSIVGEVIRLNIADDGPGIPPEHLEKIFDPFFTTKEVGHGTGLGLSICYGIIKQHGGELWIESKIGEGAAFNIDLPIIDHVGLPQKVSHAPEPDGLSPRRLLVVDDEPVIRELVSRVLEKDDCTVDAATSGEQAWRMIQETDYDCLVMDLKMPGISGILLYEVIEGTKPDLANRVIFMTGDTASPETHKFITRTGRAALPKPLNLAELRWRVAEIMATALQGTDGAV